MAEELPAQLVERLVHGRHDARDGDPRDVLRRDAAGAKEAEQHHAVLVRGALGLGLQAPVARQAVALVDADLGVRVADVDREQHRPYARYPPGSVTSPATTRTTSPPGRGDAAGRVPGVRTMLLA